MAEKDKIERAWANADEKRYLHYIGAFRCDFNSRGCVGINRKSPGEVYVDKVLAGEIDCHGIEYLKERILRLERYIQLADIREDWGNIDKPSCVGYAMAEIKTAQQLIRVAEP